MRILFKSERDILTDEAVKKRYFSKELRQAIDDSLADAAEWTPPPNHPWPHPANQDRFNRTIFNSWDLPTTFSLGEVAEDGDSATVAVYYDWGEGTQYEGNRRATSVRLVYESEGWRIDDLITHEGAFISAGSLRAQLKGGD
ncbi:hypothetical protein [Haloferula sp. A504]|uniref:hypothetical protein n=1 Tax=Haloferula sp. A504 TaxID=3373601 RepID=UPI0031CC1EE5|nr:hypothetical protein [Verrucomicrobiaceae bacterium E54]